MSRQSKRTIATLLLVLAPQLLFAQAARQGRLEVTVLDPSGAVIPAATVTISGQDGATRAAPQPAVQTSGQGIATIGTLVPGRYTVQAEFPGFETRIVKDVRVRAGDNRQAIVLTIQKQQDSVTVARDAQEAAADARGRAFGTAVAREQIDALPDSLDEAERQLRDLAGGPALIRVDGFEGAPLPPKSQIRSIHITRDAFAAENHFAGQILVDIVTQPGAGALNGGGTFRLRDGSMSGRSPFTPTKGPERTQTFSANIAGTLIDQKSSFSLALNGMTSYETPNLNVALPAGMRSEALNIRSPRDNWFGSALFDHALTKDQTLRIRFFQGRFYQRNQGIGAYDLPERAYSADQSNSSLQVQQVGPLGRRSFINTRVLYSWGHQAQASNFEAPTIRVSDAFTSGGQQVAGIRYFKTFGFGSDLDYIRGRHSVRAGAQINLGFSDSDLRSNYLGTYTFESLAAYEAGAPGASPGASAIRTFTTSRARAEPTSRTTFAFART